MESYSQPREVREAEDLTNATKELKAYFTEEAEFSQLGRDSALASKVKSLCNSGMKFVGELEGALARGDLKKAKKIYPSAEYTLERVALLEQRAFIDYFTATANFYGPRLLDKWKEESDSDKTIEPLEFRHISACFDISERGLAAMHSDEYEVARGLIKELLEIEKGYQGILEKKLKE